MNKRKRACIILPTYNESQNIRPLLTKIVKITKAINQWDIVILVVDDNSPDGTADIVKSTKQKYPNVHLLKGEKKGLGIAYIRGFRHAIKKFSPEVIFEMDADFSHPPELITEFLAKISAGADVVIGSRYISGGGTPDWNIIRKTISRGGNFFARIVAGLYNIRDCTSGFRAIRTSLIKKIDLDRLGAKGYSFQMNLLYECVKEKARIVEVPLVFLDRTKGSSKMKTKDLVEFFVNSFKLRLRTWDRFIKFCIVGGTGVFVNTGVLALFTEGFGITYKISSLIAIETAIIWNFFHNDAWTFKQSTNKSSKIKKLLKFNATSIVGAIINWAVLLIFTEMFGWYYLLANFLGILIATAWNYLVNINYTWRERL